MIPLRDQEFLRQRFREELTSRVRIDYFTRRPSRVFVPGREECAMCQDVRTLLEELAALSPRLALTVHEFADDPAAAAALGVDRVPGIVLRGQMNRPVRFFGMPSGTLFPGFIETLVEAAKGTPDLRPETARGLKKLRSDVQVQVFVLPSCPYSPLTARAALKLGLASPRVRAAVLAAGEFPALTQRHGIRAVPATVLDERLVLTGLLEEADLLQAVLRTAEGRPPSPDEVRRGRATLLGTQSREAPSRLSLTGSGLVLPR